MRLIKDMTSAQKRALVKIIIAAALLIAAVLIPVPATFTATGAFLFRLALFMVPYLVIGGEVLLEAVRNIAQGEVFDENFLMALATVGAFCLGENAEAVVVMLFYQVGELFQSCAVSRSRKSISQLMDIRPDSAFIERNGQLVEVKPDDVNVDDIIVVKPGERVPLDGVVIEGTSSLDASALTGESVPRDVTINDAVQSGCINRSGLLRVRVSSVFAESTVSRILELVESASERKAAAENFITKFARVYTPAVVLCAALLVIVPSLFDGQWAMWLTRALTFLVISCPCALVISIPLSFFGGIGGASRQGILIKGSNYLEALAKSDMVVFDKTGTLTRGVFRVFAVHPSCDAEHDAGHVCCAHGAHLAEGHPADCPGCDKCQGDPSGMALNASEKALLEYAALAESYSDHPISISLKQAYSRKLDSSRTKAVVEHAGQGISALVDGKRVLAGNAKLMAANGIAAHSCTLPGTIIHIAIEGKYQGHIVISDEVKPDARQAIADLKACGVRRTVMLTGDNQAVADYAAAQLGIDEVHAGLMPADKVAQVERLLAECDKAHLLAFVGDGINDAPVLTRADIGIAMGALGSDAAIEAADIVLMDDKPSKIAEAMRISRKTLGIVRQNIVFALVTKVLILVLGALGFANMWWAVFADVGVSVIAILNAMRALRS